MVAQVYTFVWQYSTSSSTKIRLIHMIVLYLSSSSVFQLIGHFPSLSANLLLAVIPSLLTITHVPSRHRDIHTACLQQGHKEPCLHQYSHISALCCATNHTLTAREASDRGCVMVLLANIPVLSGSKELSSFLLYLRQQRHNKLSVEIHCWVQSMYLYACCKYI